MIAPDLETKTTAPLLNATRRRMGPRGWKILHTSAWSLVAKCAAAANLFLTVPFVLRTLGSAEFGTWATLVSLVMFAGFLDFGFGNGTMNLVAAAHGRGASSEIGQIIREGSRNVLWVAAGLGVIILVAIPVVPWYTLLGLPQALAGSCRASVAVVLVSIMLAVPFNLAYRIQLGLGQGDRTFRWQTIGQVATTIAVITLAKVQGTLPILTAAAVATPLLASVANTIMLWRAPLMARAWSPTSKRKIIAKNIRHEGVSFFVLQLTAALAFSADLPLISALRGPVDAGSYAITQRLFSIISIGLSLFWAPLWPIYRHALASGDFKWVARTFRRSVAFAAAIAVATAVILAASFHNITHIWIHRSISVSNFLLCGFALWCVIDAIGTALGTLLNAASILRYQLIYAPIFSCVSLTLKAIALRSTGITALPWITSFCYILLVLLPISMHAKIIRHKIANTKY